MNQNVEKYISNEQIAYRIIELSNKINKKYIHFNEEIIIIGLLKSSFIFIADLCRNFNFCHKIDFMITTRYGNKIHAINDVKLIKDLSIDIYGKNVLLVEDVIDSGITINMIYKNLLLRKPKSLEICTLLNKKSERLFNLSIEYFGFIIPDFFAVGYGMDYDEKYRHLPYIGKLLIK